MVEVLAHYRITLYVHLMNTTQRITKAATAKGLTVTTEGGQLVVLNGAKVTASATIQAGRFHGGYTTDALGHIVSHSTVGALVAAI